MLRKHCWRLLKVANNKLIIKGAREHNLKNINLTLEKDSLIVISGLSGSGKSSLAFDTIFAEGQRRYVESLSAYARQFLGRLEKPDVDYMEGLSPSIAIEQKSTNKNPRSIVGTITEIYDYYRLLWARVGTPYCPSCGREITEMGIDQIIDAIFVYGEGSKIMVSSPVAIGKKGEYKKVFHDARHAGFQRAKVDGELKPLDELTTLDKKFNHNIDIVVDRLILNTENRTRLSDSLETAIDMSNGLVKITLFNGDDGEKTELEEIFSQKNSCPHCGITIPELEPRLFSFNNPFGACPTCHGLGEESQFDIDKIIPDFSLSFNEHAIKTHNPTASWNKVEFAALAKEIKFSLDTPINKLPKKILDVILYGYTKKLKMTFLDTEEGTKYEQMKKFEGVIKQLQRREYQTGSPQMRNWYESFKSSHECGSCHGKKLRVESLNVLVGEKNIMEITELSVKDSIDFFKNLKLNETKVAISKEVIKEINSRLSFLMDVGLSYLTLNRSSGTLSGGEAQRIRLATQIGSALTGVLYVLDEPSIGLHQRDNALLIKTLKHLRDIGNTLIVVEHDEATIRAADYLVDIGPGAGIHGGNIIGQGTPEEVSKIPESITGQFLAGKLTIPVPTERRKGNGDKIRIEGASKNNLKGINVDIPLGKLVVFTGVSGSGKSTLLNQILVQETRRVLNGKTLSKDGFTKISGLENIDKLISIDQSPIGRTPRSNPATYVGVFTPIRELFASLPESKARGYKSGRFSFNVAGGRCENCKGDGQLKIEMHFLPDVFVGCDVCHGKRFNQETLNVKYKGKSIHDVLDMTVEEAAEFFAPINKIRVKLETLVSVGLGYLKLGQSALTLSGGEAQRVKLSLELSKRSTGKTLYVLDEPTTGLHFADVKLLVVVINRLVDAGNTVILIEHNLDVIKVADYIIDLGPEGGDEGGTIVVSGTPEKVAKFDKSYTGKFLAPMLK
ncbi:MAG: excinuclease ABC subunit UvrA [Spirochaetaceae bacterium]|nr:excinuclease ABC subunit UvrA [Spirochaetaceae bacterium]